MDKSSAIRLAIAIASAGVCCFVLPNVVSNKVNTNAVAGETRMDLEEKIHNLEEELYEKDIYIEELETHIFVFDEHLYFEYPEVYDEYSKIWEDWVSDIDTYQKWKIGEYHSEL